MYTSFHQSVELGRSLGSFRVGGHLLSCQKKMSEYPMSYSGRIHLIAGWCGLVLIVGGCTTVLPPADHGAANESSQRCVPAMTKRARVAAAGDETPVTPTTEARSRFSSDALQVAEVVGVLPLVNHLASDTGSSRRDPLASVVLRQRITEILLLTLFEITSTTAELTCERDRADQVADRIDEIDGARVKRLTIASILFGELPASSRGESGWLRAPAWAGRPPMWREGLWRPGSGCRPYSRILRWNSAMSATCSRKSGKIPRNPASFLPPSGGTCIERMTKRESFRGNRFLTHGIRQAGWEKTGQPPSRNGAAYFSAQAAGTGRRNYMRARLCWRRWKPRSGCSMKSWKC